MDVGSIRARIELDTRQWSIQQRQIERDMRQMSGSAQRVSKDIGAIQKASMAMGAALVGGLAMATKSAADYEQALANVAAVSGASASELEQLSKAAKEMSESSQFDATQILGGAEELIKAGLTVEQTINGLKGALDLATAGGVSLAEASEIASVALNSFKKDALSVSDAADILSSAANVSATDVNELRLGLSMVSAVASGVGLTFKDTAGALALFANNGLKSSDAGTSLKSLLLTLSPSTKEAAEQMKKLGLMTKDGSSAFYDANGHIKSMADIAEILKTKLAKLTDEQRQLALKTMFGTDAIRSANILYSAGAKGINEMSEALSKIKAADVAAVKMDTLKGAFKEFQNTLKNLGVEIGDDLLPVFTDIVKGATEIVHTLGKVDGTAVKAGLAFVAGASAVGLMGAAIAKLSVALRAFALTPAGAAITALSVIGGLVASAIVQTKEMSKVALENANSMIEQHDALESNIAEYDRLTAKSKLSTEELGRFVDTYSLMKKTADPNVIKQLTDEQNKLREKSGLSSDELTRLVDVNKKIIETVPGASVKISEQGNALLENSKAAKKYNEEQLKGIQLELEHQRAVAESKMKENLADEALFKKQINAMNKEHNDLLADISDKEDDIAKANAKIAEAKRLNNEAAEGFWKDELFNAEQDLNIMKKTNAEMTGNIIKKQEALDKVREEIGKLDEVKRKIVDITMQQAGLTAKRGEELAVIDTSISKLKEQKKTLQDTTPINQRNTQEYEESVSAIEQQISKLQGAKSKIEEIIGKAQAMNAELGKDINKTIYQRTIATGDYNNAKANALKYHSGGIVAPKLHDGGLASRFAQTPSHNEIDVRLLRNELVLTEQQQSNLFKMIDAGIVGKGADSLGGITKADFDRLARAMEYAANRPVSIELDGREVAKGTYKDIDQMISFEKDRRGRF
ncbi:MAG: phage tail tape measure protein [Bacillus sp. (in: firmicutes)]